MVGCSRASSGSRACPWPPCTAGVWSPAWRWPAGRRYTLRHWRTLCLKPSTSGATYRGPTWILCYRYSVHINSNCLQLFSQLLYILFPLPFLLALIFHCSKILQKSNIEVYQKIYQGAREFATEDQEVLSISGDVHFRKLMTEKYVFISPVPHLQTVSFSDCRSLLSTERFVEDNSAFGVPEDSPLKEIFSLRSAKEAVYKYM